MSIDIYLSIYLSKFTECDGRTFGEVPRIEELNGAMLHSRKRRVFKQIQKKYRCGPFCKYSGYALLAYGHSITDIEKEE